MNRFKRLKKLVFLVVLVLISVYFSTASAIDSLDSGRDILNTNALSAFSSHNIRFTLPVSSTPIEADDYIQIELSYFTDISPATTLLGDYTGTPVFSVIANIVKITGISVSPGGSLNIRGITAYNPSEPNLFDVYIRITHDVDGFNIKNQVHIIATKTDGSIVISASIDAEVGLLRISGYGSPEMFITFTEGTTVIGTTTADESGYFSQIFPGISPNNHNIFIYGVDTSDRTTPATYVEVYTRDHETTTVSGIILPPTIIIDKEQIAPGETVTINGRGTPGYKATIMTEPPVNSFEVTVDNNGDYGYAFSDTAALELGDHRVYALVSDLLGTSSLFSLTQFFRVANGSPPGGGTPDCDISHGDLNCDSAINLFDFSILLYYWDGADTKADINNDGSVNLFDFSIMMFYWQG